MAIIETRGIWLTTTDSKVLRSKQGIAEAMDLLAETGFNVVFPVVWNKAVTLYPSQIMQQTFGVEIDPMSVDRDPLEEVVVEARRVGLKVIPWFEYGFASSYNLNGGVLLQKKPEWAARDCNGNLLKKNGFEWLNALDAQVQEFLLSLVLEVVKNYDVDGVQGDDRFPALPCEGGYDEVTVNRYRQEFDRNPPQNPKDRQWLQWRADILSEFLARLYQEVKAVNPNLLIAIAPNIYDWAFQEYLQDSPTWLKRGIVDMIQPQIYRRDFRSYAAIADKLVNQQFTDAILPKLAPGILMKLGSYCISSEYLVQAIEYNRQLGIQGEVFFFYEGLRENNNTLAKVLRNGPYAKSASFPTLSDLSAGGVSHKKTSSIWPGLQRVLKKIF
ncbi:MAG: glycoside hydrolase family 10 protein [Nostoc sp. EfeVER01]|uniref:glycoside hydrolase family 10 protein n=1 Tax=unclassified Nostoc TaxID=2593658 RepID=UPI002AD4C5EF|nr:MULTISPECIES: family 10 glycosylhydrolase [unclassified Nostoc]MDZ7944647.1 family 10 glycosylhydrolase [Nostoc sp. EfeVER01]MDZ7993694.1 family 10 glycosylhydrolase [Nostoc sp. EspVER01]